MEARSWFRMLQAPEGAQLEALLDFAAARRAHYPTFLLVQREVLSGQAGDAAAFASHGSPAAPSNSRKHPAPELTDLIDALEPHLITQATTDRWPGSAPGEGRARVLFYRLDHQSALALAKVQSLAGFVPPLPEDLCVLANDKTPWLVTSSRSGRFLLHLTHDEERAIAKSLPWMRLEPEAVGPEFGRET